MHSVTDVDVLRVDAVMPVRGGQELDENMSQSSSPPLLRSGQAVAGMRATRGTLDTTSLTENRLGIHAHDDDSSTVGHYSSCKCCGVGISETG